MSNALSLLPPQKSDGIYTVSEPAPRPPQAWEVRRGWGFV